jgi:hypothetical protein
MFEVVEGAEPGVRVIERESAPSSVGRSAIAAAGATFETANPVFSSGVGSIPVARQYQGEGLP